MAERTTIRVTKAVRDHLAQVAKDQGMTLGQLIERFAAEQSTAEQIADRADEEFDRTPDMLANIYRVAAEKVWMARGTAGHRQEPAEEPTP
jgi:predicted DNA-binding ribbon-helix-helix protein